MPSAPGLVCATQMMATVSRKLIGFPHWTSTFFGLLLSQPVLSGQDKNNSGLFREAQLGADNSSGHLKGPDWIMWQMKVEG